MNLPKVAIPSVKGATLRVSAKSYSNVAKAAEDAASDLRQTAKGATPPHPRTVVDFYAKASADLAAIKAAAESELSAIDTAISVLDGEPSLTNHHPLVMTAMSMRFTVEAFSQSKGLAKDKAIGLSEEARSQLQACRSAMRRALDDHAHREDSLQNKAADAIRISIANHDGPLRVSLKEVGQLITLWGAPADDTPLPAADFNPRLPADHPARRAAVLKTICASREAEAEMKRKHHMAKAQAAVKPKTTADLVSEELAQLGDV